MDSLIANEGPLQPESLNQPIDVLHFIPVLTSLALLGIARPSPNRNSTISKIHYVRVRTVLSEPYSDRVGNELSTQPAYVCFHSVLSESVAT